MSSVIEFGDGFLVPFVEVEVGDAAGCFVKGNTGLLVFGEFEPPLDDTCNSVAMANDEGAAMEIGIELH